MKILSTIIARIWSWRSAHREARQEALRTAWTAEFVQWKRENPGRCMYCAHVRWANDVQRVAMALEPHTCVEGHSPSHPLPIARALA